jgi:putative Mn2+ efflux pump MntP
MGGIVVFGILSKVLGVKGMVSFVMLVIGAFLGLYLGKRFTKFVNSGCTSLIGAFMIVRGIGCYAPGYPNELGVSARASAGNLNFKNEVYFYFGGFVILAIAGTIFQMKNHRLEEEGKEDDYMKQDEDSRKCGCF